MLSHVIRLDLRSKFAKSSHTETFSAVIVLQTLSKKIYVAVLVVLCVHSL